MNIAKRIAHLIAGTLVWGYESGFFLSCAAGKPVNKRLEAIPWWPYPLIEWLDRCPLEGKNILEFGSGQSTLYFDRRGAKIESYEHNFEWAKYVSSELYLEGQVIAVDSLPAGIKPLRTSYDMIIVDSINRRACLELASRMISADGTIIADDTGSWDLGMLPEFKRTNFTGMRPAYSLKTTATLFSRKAPEKIETTST